MKNIFYITVTFFLLAGFFSCGTADGNRSRENGTDGMYAGHNSRNSLDWDGTYTGIIPSASVSGINVQITLNSDETFLLNYQYIDRSDDVYTRTGTFKWDNSGSIITLDIQDIPPFYKVGENTLTQLDMHGNIIDGELAENYVLIKQ